VLSDESVAVASEVEPRYELSYVSTSQTQFGSSDSSQVSSGCHRNGAERYVVVLGFTPSSTASARTNVLNAEPACRRPCAARLNWMFLRCGATAVIARIAPFAGLIETIAEAGSSAYGSVRWIASIA
jgi:hypothetical protein